HMARHKTPRDKLLSVFDAMAEAIAKPNYRGCAFLRASAEMPDDASGRTVCREARRWTRELFANLAKETGAAEPEVLARQLQLLYDGTAASAQMERDPGVALCAKAAAEVMIDATCTKRA